MRFRVLGPVEIDRDGSAVALARRQERCLLGILLLEQGRLVPVDRLCDLLWEGQPPEHARRSLQSHAARIRSALADASLVSRSGGYALRVEPDRVDAHRFRCLVRDASASSDPAQRDEMLRAALALWRGPALQDAASDRLRGLLCADLEELRLHAIEESIDAGLTLGRPLVAELAGLTAAHPTRERLVELQMRALHQAGRTADALDAFARIRARLADELGADPGPALTRLHQAILRGESVAPVAAAVASAVASAPRVPRCLPRDIADFTGRESALASLLAAIPSRPDSPSAILAVDGMAGVGKTALAVRLAHRVAQRYPDGQLAIDLHGHSEQAPIDPAMALDRLLRQLGVAGDRIPDGLDARIELWRTELAGRRVLLLLDNASTSDQVAPLLPTGPGCLTLVTSRRRLGAIDGAHALALEVLTGDEAIALMHRIVGPRILADAAAAAEVARRCQYLTLAVRLAAARLAHRPSWTVRDLLSRLDPGLDEIAVDGRSVVAAFRLSYDHVSTGAQRMFRLLGLHPGPDIEVRAAASLADLELDAADAVLNELVDAHLLDEPTAGRYAFHDLLKEYATRLSSEEAEADRHAAMTRLLDYYLHSAAAASHVMELVSTTFDYQLGPRPRFAVSEPDITEALTWFAVERANLTSIIAAALAGDWYGHAWRLARALWRHLYEDGFHDDSIAVMTTVLEAAKATGDATSAGMANNYLAGSYYQRGQWDQALHHIDEAILRRRYVGDIVPLVLSIENRCKILFRRGRYLEARAEAESALQRLTKFDPHHPLAFQVELQIGLTNLILGDDQAAERAFRSCVARTEERAPSSRSTAIAHAHLGALALKRKQFTEALEILRQANQGSLMGTPALEVECDLGTVYRCLGDFRMAQYHHCRALTAMIDQRALFGECNVRLELATTLHQAGEDSKAIKHVTEALEIARRLDLKHQRARALDIFAAIRQDDALRMEADSLYRDLGISRLEVSTALAG